MRYSVLTTSAMLAALTLPAAAFEFTGATLTLENRESDDLISHLHFTGSVELSFGTGFSAQVGIKNTDLETLDFYADAYELHLIWRPAQAEGLALGVFVGNESFRGSGSNGYSGLEVRYVTERFGVEAAAMGYDPGFGGGDQRHGNIQLTYQISDRFAAFGGYTRYVDGGGSNYTDYVYLGAAFQATEAVSIYGSFGNVARKTSDIGDVVTLGLRYDIGQGTTFRARDWFELNPFID